SRQRGDGVDRGRVRLAPGLKCRVEASAALRADAEACYEATGRFVRAVSDAAGTGLIAARSGGSSVRTRRSRPSGRGSALAPGGRSAAWQSNSTSRMLGCFIGTPARAKEPL